MIAGTGFLGFAHRKINYKAEILRKLEIGLQTLISENI